MKTKKLNKKLQINKTTVSNLNISDQVSIRAGAGGSGETGDSDPTNCATYYDCTESYGDFCTEGWYCRETFACGTMVSPCDRTFVVCTDTDIECR